MEATTTEARTETRTMQAVVHTHFGQPGEALEVEEVAVPTIGSAEVLVALDASGIAIGDYLTITGRPYIARPMFGIRTPKQRIAGSEMAGTVVAVGDDVTRFAVGDEVFGFGNGTLAEYVALSQDAVAARPASITTEQAAAVPVSGLAALQAVRDTGGVTAGQKVLVVGASGAVGTFAVQIAKTLGAEVTGVASGANIAMVRSIGADDVIDYTREGLAARGEAYDVIIDLAGNRGLKELRSVLAPTGTVVLVGGTGGPTTMGFGRTIRAMALNLFVRQTLAGFMAKDNGEDLETLGGMLAAGEIVPVIDRSYPLERIVKALEHVGSRHTSGKTVITV
jgi:NADPH:quinone reductase-like Zn-dependent oxidoreductase